MGRYLVLFALSTTIIWANTNKKEENNLQIHLLPQETKGFDGDHQNSGCPENSECDQVMGLQYKRWQNLLRNLQLKEKSSQKQGQYVQGHLELYGIPVEFYTTHKSAKTFRPIYYNSPCREHNPKDKPLERVLRAMSFVKKTSKDTVTIWRDQAQLEIPFSDDLVFADLDITTDEGVQTLKVPLDEEPLYLTKNGPVFLREDDGLFYALQIDYNGVWKVINLDMTTLSNYESKKRSTQCGEKEKGPKLSGPFNVAICKDIWDDSAKKLRPVVLRRGCHF